MLLTIGTGSVHMHCILNIEYEVNSSLRILHVFPPLTFVSSVHEDNEKPIV